MREATSLLLMVVLAAPCAAQEQPIGLPELLQQAADMDWLWRSPAEGERGLQFSSYDRASHKGPGDPQAWYANGDRGKYLRAETRVGRREFVLVDAEGPGAVVRIWSANPSGRLFFYVDGAKEPTWEIGFQDLTQGKRDPILDPLAGVRARGWNCHVPFPFQKRLKITGTAGDVYYHVNVRRFPASTRVVSFRPEHLKEHAAELRALRTRLQKGVTTTLKPTPRALPATVEGPGVVRSLRLRLKPKDETRLEDLLRSVLLSVTCDGHEVVRVPVGDFFGSAPEFRPYGGWPMRVTPSGWGECRWPMPVAKQATIALVHDDELAFDAELEVAFEERALPPDALRLHAAWNQERGVATRPFRDHLVLDAKGPGRFVGCTLVVRNPVKVWWGEGDEKFWVDGEAFPSTFGTGTEDYFGYAWCSPRVFSSVFHAQPQCDGPGNRGYTCNNRYQINDSVPFQRSFRFDLEVWHWAQVKVDYATTAYWYAPAAAASGLPAVPPAAERRPVPLPPIWRAEGSIEGERLRGAERPRGVVSPQDMAPFAGRWSNGEQLWWRGGLRGDRLVLLVPVAASGRYVLHGRFTRAADYGRVQVRVGEKAIGEVLDFYSTDVRPSGELRIGEVELKKGDAQIGFELVGKHPKSIGFMVGIDALRLEPVNGR